MNSAYPIQFSPAMVCAIRDRVKTQTRRLATSPLAGRMAKQTLYVREAFELTHIAELSKGRRVQVRTISDGLTHYAMWPEHCAPPKLKRYPAMHMPKALSRFALCVRSVRLEPLHQIGPMDAIAEGVAHPAANLPAELDPVDRFAQLWDSLHHGADQWAKNPMVVRLAFLTTSNHATVQSILKDS